VNRYAICAAAGAIAGFLLAWWIWRPVSPIETAAPAVTLPSGAVVAERVPDAPLPPVAAEAARELRGEVARAGSVTVQPRTPDAAPSETPAAGSAVPAALCLCKPDPITLDWTMTTLRDGSSRMSWYTDDGEITGATDIPVSTVSVRRERPWAAGASWTPGKREYGLWATRDVGPFVIGAEVQQRGREGLVGMVRAGIRF
jgi:hypothetical protein